MSIHSICGPSEPQLQYAHISVMDGLLLSLIVVFVVCLLPPITQMMHNVTGNPELLMLDKEISSIVTGTPSGERQLTSFGVYSAYEEDKLCVAGAQCTPLSSCRLIKQLMNKNCLAANKMREITRGYEGDEPQVCCPTSAIRENAESTNEESCGQPILYNWWKINYQGVGALPFVARIGFRSKTQGTVSYPCCGSIISKRVVLTSAHCALAQTAKQFVWTVRVGEFDTSTDPDCGKTFCAHPVQDILISHVIIHPGYESKTFRHNVALLVLKHDINFTVNAQPVCLRSTLSSSIVGQRALLVGWGKTPGQLETPNQQQKIEMPVLQRKKCTEVYDDVIPVTQDHLCVGGEKNKDACSGFGGAPLLYVDTSEQPRYFQIGIVSFGSDKCGAQGVPSVYSSIDRYLEWIRRNTPAD